MKHVSRWKLVALAAVVGLSLSGAQAAFGQTVDKCQQQIEKIGRGFQDQILKALFICKDKYRQTVVKFSGTPPPTELDKAADACGKALDKVLGTPNGLGAPTLKTQAEKTFKKLNDLLGTGKCTDAHLIQLGHLPSAQFGNAWIRWQLVAMLKSAYEKQLWLVADLPNILAALVDPDPTPATKSCAIAPPAGSGVNLCNVLKTSPCQTLACRVDGANTQLVININTFGLIPSALSGEIIQEYCQFPLWTGCDTAVVGNSARGIDPVSFAGNTACTTNMRTEGWVKGPNTCTITYCDQASCGGVNTVVNASSVINGPKDVSICQDVCLPGNPCSSTNDCPGSPTFSIPVLTGNCGAQPTHCDVDGNPTTTNGVPGPINVTLGGSLGTGDTFTAATLQIHTQNGTACPGGTTPPTNVPLFFTTGTASVDVLDAGPGCNTTVSVGPFTGNAMSSYVLNNNGAGDYLDSSDLGTLTTGGGFPGACSATLPDLATGFKLVCKSTHN